MNIDISEQAKVSDILNTVKNADEGSHIYCSSERHFSLLKICLVKLQKVDLNIYLLDQHGFTIKQVSATKKSASIAVVEATTVDDDALITGFLGDTGSSIDEGPGPVLVAASPIQSISPATEQAEEDLQDRSTTDSVVEQGMTAKQISVLRDLEQALRRCKEQEILVIGFSDGLVAVPEAMGYGADAISSADALEVEAFDVYRGYEAEEGG